MGNRINLPEFCNQIAALNIQDVQPEEPRSLVGMFQKLRPDPAVLEPIFDQVVNGDEVYERLVKVYEICGHPRRPDGMKDAFFIVRDPDAVAPEVVQSLGQEFFKGLGLLAFELNHDELATCLQPIPEIRLVEGAVPKHPKSEEEKSNLLKQVTKAGPAVTDELRGKMEIANFLSRATYFIACDAFLRDFILWPWMAEHSNVEDPFESYFQFWKHGVKFRIFGEKQIDLYLPRFL